MFEFNFFKPNRSVFLKVPAAPKQGPDAPPDAPQGAKTLRSPDDYKRQADETLSKMEDNPLMDSFALSGNMNVLKANLSLPEGDFRAKAVNMIQATSAILGAARRTLQRLKGDPDFQKESAQLQAQYDKVHAFLGRGSQTEFTKNDAEAAIALAEMSLKAVNRSVPSISGEEWAAAQPETGTTETPAPIRVKPTKLGKLPKLMRDQLSGFPEGAEALRSYESVVAQADEYVAEFRAIGRNNLADLIQGKIDRIVTAQQTSDNATFVQMIQELQEDFDSFDDRLARAKARKNQENV